MKISNIKIIEDGIKIVSCSGDKDSGTHPEIFLKFMDGQDSIECYYCGKTFIHKSKFKKNNV
ncbi:MAG: hypothetical protein CMD73_01755 [Gammaproteobacteria bacterium]|nr:hypothetical protein [Gammaproteobacteria bacterium]